MPKDTMILETAVCHMQSPNEVNERVFEDTIRRLIRIVTNDPAMDRHYEFSRKPRLYRNFAEPIILRKLYGDPEGGEEAKSLHEYALAKECGLHRTQVTRALRSLTEKRAIRVVESTRWRTGRQKKLYTMTSLGRLLLTYEGMGTIETWYLLETLEDCSAEFGSSALSHLTGSVMQVDNEEKRRKYALALFDLLLEYRGRLWQPEANWPLVCDFVKRTWLGKDDIVAHVGHLTQECRFLLEKAREVLTTATSQIDTYLAKGE